jgi:alpha-beta hydrolase superfamily lysophospholipase
MLRHILVLALLGGCATASTAPEANTDLEESVCNVVLEPFAFWLWQRSAGTPYLRDGRLPANVEVIHHRTQDGRVLYGYRLKASTEPGAAPKGFVLVAQGNATLAERLVGRLRGLAESGYDVYLYDYRGYARSEGKRRLKAIVSDYQELYAELSRDRPGERLLYGMSFGGIVLLKVIASGAGFDRAVLDSTPSTVSNYGCPRHYDPVANLPADASRLLLISGARDRVVAAEDSAALVDAAAARGARSVRSPDFAHPFMDKDPAVAGARQQLIHGFLIGH